MSDLRRTTWRANISVEFEIYTFPICERDTAQRQAEMTLRAAQRGSTDPNVSRPIMKVISVRHIKEPGR